MDPVVLRFCRRSPSHQPDYFFKNLYPYDVGCLRGSRIISRMKTKNIHFQPLRLLESRNFSSSNFQFAIPSSRIRAYRQLSAAIGTLFLSPGGPRPIPTNLDQSRLHFLCRRCSTQFELIRLHFYAPPINDLPVCHFQALRIGTKK